MQKAGVVESPSGPERDVGLFEAVLEGLRDEPLNIVVTVGYDNDPAALATGDSTGAAKVFVER